MSAVELERGLQELATLAGAAPAAGSALAGQPSDTRLTRARRELARVERAEFALLLRRAAALRLAGATRADGALADGLREVLDLAAAQRRPWPRRLERLALRVAQRPAQDWPSAARLARTAHALAPLLASRALLAEALAAQGRLREALGDLACALSAIPRAARPRRLLEPFERLLAQAEVAPCDAGLALVCARLRRALRAEGAA